MKKNTLHEIITGGMMVSLGIIIPIIFHSFSLLGKIFLPMHIPILIGGFFLSPPIAFLVGVITPLLSSLITGMPPMFPMAVIMSFELGSYGALVSFFSKKLKLNIFLSLGISLIFGRIVAGLVVFLLVKMMGINLNPVLFMKGGVLTGIPGIIIQFIFIPTVVIGLKKFLIKEIVK